MKVSLKWLADFVEVAEFFDKPEVLAEALTRGGLEVEEIKDGRTQYQHVVTGLILSKEAHPGSDRLSVCQVTTGDGVLHRIVCGAQNHKANDRVVVALPGAHLPNGMKIVTAQVRGVESAGMLCSNEELGIATDTDGEKSVGIRILPVDAPIGMAFAKYAGLDDVTMELKVTPNRADCLSHYGLAREISCLLERPLKVLKPNVAIGETAAASTITVDVAATGACPRYCGRMIHGVRIAASPEWLIKRLENVGLRSINNVVDITNYVMMELGQPLHAFDADQIQSRKIIVNLAKSGEAFEALDGKKHQLLGDELVIRDGDRPVALAGVIGGLNSGVTNSTQNIFLESAYFEPSQVRKSSRALGIQTDSSYRFSRGVNPQMTLDAMNRATELILQIAGGAIAKEVVDIYPRPIPRKWIALTVQTVSDRLGYAADEKHLESFCQRLGCEVKKDGAGNFEIMPPLFRRDLDVDMDLVEEYARLNGYEKIPESLPVYRMEPAKHDTGYLKTVALGAKLRALGYSEAVNSVFVGRADETQFLGDRSRLNELGLEMNGASVGLINPLSEDQNCLRSTLAYSMWKCLQRNYSQTNTVGRLYEIGPVTRNSEKSGYIEQWRLSLLAWGQPQNLWSHPEYPLVFELKKVLEEILAPLAAAAAITMDNLPVNRALSFLHSGQTGEISYGAQKIGFFGAIHPVLLADSKIRVPAALAEIRLEGLDFLSQSLRSYQPFSRFPSVDRDVSLVVQTRVSAGAMVKEVRALGEAFLSGVEIFDLYQGDKIPDHTKALGLRLKFQGKESTLRDEEVNGAMERILSVLRDKFSAQLR